MVDGRGFDLQDHKKGYFLGGRLFDKITPQCVAAMRIWKEEIFFQCSR